MLFNSLAFAVFFPVVTLLYFLLPQRFRNHFLLAASCYFYISFIPKYIFILFFLITLDYLLGIKIENSPAEQKRSWLVLSIGANVLTLVFFKYFNFFSGISILLPIGLSFHTMQSMGYVIEVALGNQKAERNYFTYALYVMFYPQLVAGPIERPQNLLKQFYVKHRFDVERALSGAGLMLFGFYKKVVVADFVSVLVNPVYAAPLKHTGWDICLAVVAFSIQIFGDFSGYSDIARGAARVMGFELMLNFNQPFNSRSMAELWHRWHISLSSWFRDYLYIPLGGSQISTLRTYLNIMVVFVISGLWHGPTWGFLYWGGLNGLMLVLLELTKNIRRNFSIFRNPVLATTATFLYFSFTLIFFRSSSVHDAFYIVGHLLSGGRMTIWNSFNVGLAVALVISLELIHYVQRNYDLLRVKFATNHWVRWSIYYVLALVFCILTYLSLISQNEANQPFIYFQF